MSDQPARHYLWLYRLRIQMSEEGTTKAPAHAVGFFKQLVEKLSVMDPEAPVRFTTSDGVAKFANARTGEVLAELKLPADV
jgi:hypothetical protein